MEALGLDLKIIIAQIINFGLLLVILKKVLYKPIIEILDKRRARVEETLINNKKSEDRLVEIEEERKEILHQAQSKAEKEREELIKNAKDEKERIIDEAKELAEKEAEKGIAKVKLAEAEATARIKNEVSEKVVEDLTKKLTLRPGNNLKHPFLEEILK